MSSVRTPQSLLRFLPMRRWWPRVSRGTLRDDVLAGLTGSIVLVPQGVAFATIAGMPPEYGLYAAMVPAIIAALFGSSWHLVSGPTTAISIVVFSALSPLAEPGSAEFVRLALTLSFLVGIFQLALGWARLGTLVNFVSHTVVVGFTAGAAVLIAASQAKNFFGLDVQRGSSLAQTLWALVTRWHEINPWVTGIALVTLVSSVLSKRVMPKIPHMIVGMVVGGLAAWVLHRFMGQQATGVRTVGALNALLPPLSVPDLSPQRLYELIPIAIALGMLALTEAVAIARSMALNSGQRIDGNQEFVGQGLSNMLGSFFSAYPSSGSFNRSGLNLSASAKTPLAAVFSAILLVAILLVVAPLAAYLPVAAMAGILFLVAWGLIDRKHIAEILRGSRGESAVLVVTFVATLVMQLEFAIYVGVLLSLMMYLNRTSRPGLDDVKPNPGPGHFHFSDDTDLPDCPQLKMLRINGSLFFGATDHVENALTAVDEATPSQKHLLIVAGGMNFVDLAGAELLARESVRRRKLGGGLYLANVKREVQEALARSGHDAAIGGENLFSFKTDPIAQLYPRLDASVCAGCTRKIFRQCRQALPDGSPVPG